MVADVVGFSRLMETDEAGTFRALQERFSTIVEPLVADNAGRIVKYLGDGALVEFASAVNAVTCALAIQGRMTAANGNSPEAERIQFRIGVNLGDVIGEGADIFGDGVNIAARVESLAEASGICITSIVLESLGNRLNVSFTDAGVHHLKNLSRPVRVYRWKAQGAGEAVAILARPLALPEKPSIAILPFNNMSTDPEQEFFSEGIAEDITTELSRFRSLFVIARNSSFAFKGQNLDVMEIGRRLGVRYVLEGSVRRAGNRLRITAQLIDATDNSHLWADRYDRTLHDVFAIQDEVTHSVVTTIEPQLSETERQRARRKAPENLDAWESYQRGLWHLYRYTDEEIRQGVAFMEIAISKDPEFALAHAGLAFALYMLVLYGASEDQEEALPRALAAGQRAVLLDGNDPSAHTALARVYTIRAQHEMAIEHCRLAIALNPSHASAHFGYAHSLWMSGRAEEALSFNAQAIRLSPRDPMLTAYLASRSIALTLLEQYEEALDCARRGLQQPNANLFAAIAELAALGHLGRRTEALPAIERARAFKANINTSFVLKVLPITDPAYRDRFKRGLLDAGLPE
jgi:adenylate cyclase